MGKAWLNYNYLNLRISLTFMAKPGDYVRVEKEGQIFEGIVMPTTDASDKKITIIKLYSGYNIGIEKPAKVTVLKKGKLSENKIPTRKISSKAKTKVSFITTGGTIGTHVDYKTGGVFMCRNAEEIIATTPEIAEIVDIVSFRSPFTIGSEDMTPKHWRILAKVVFEEINKGVDGVIIAHGTDTMTYTAAALSFMIEDLPIPVVLVGSQRSPDRGSFDGVQNLLCAAKYCTLDIAEVAVVMHANSDDDYCYAHRGTRVKKLHSSRRDAFKSVNAPPLAKLHPKYKTVILSEDYRKRSLSKPKLNIKIAKVALVKITPFASPKILDWYVKNGVKGIVIEGTGLGHVHTKDSGNDWIPTIKKLVKKGIPVVMSTQTIFGRTHPFVYRNLRLVNDAGVIWAEDMHSDVALVKLSFVLGKTRNMKKIRELMSENIAGEFDERTLFRSDFI